MNNRSDDIKQLSAAYCAMQAELPIAQKSSKSQRGKYADLVEVVSASRPILAQHGLSVIQQITTDTQGNISLQTTLLHTSGEYIFDTMPLYPEKSMTNGSNYNHALGGCITYFKRYAYMAIIGMVAEDEDNDGEVYSSYHKPVATPKPKISADQLKELERHLNGYDSITDRMKKYFKITNLADLPAEDHAWTVSKIIDIKNKEYGSDSVVPR